MRRLVLVCFVLGCGGNDPGPACGDGVLDDGEICDDGNTASGDGCSAACNSTEVCGNGIMDLAEVCDDGNNVDGDACSALCQVANPAALTVNWQFQDLATNTNTDCPAGFDTVAVISQRLDTTAAPFVDLFTCADKTGTAAALPPTQYAVHIEVENQGATMTYAQSLAAEVDLANVDKTVSFTIFNDGGYFELAWSLVGGTSNSALACADVANLSAIEITSTLGTEAFADQFDCADGSGVTAGLLAGTYTISVAALDQNAQALGPVQNQADKVVLDTNQVTDLGTITLPIDGL